MNEMQLTFVFGVGGAFFVLGFFMMAFWRFVPRLQLCHECPAKNVHRQTHSITLLTAQNFCVEMFHLFIVLVQIVYASVVADPVFPVMS